MGIRSDGTEAIDVQFPEQAPWSALNFIGAVNRRGGGVGAGSPDRANVRASRIVRIDRAAAQVGDAIKVVPVGVVVRVHAKVGTAGNLQVIGQAGMGHGEIVCGRVAGIGQVIGEGGVGISYDLAVPVIFHHDDKNVIQLWHSL